MAKIKRDPIVAQQHQKQQPRFPAWYQRIRRRIDYLDEDIEPEDFDEDISDLEDTWLVDNDREPDECYCEEDEEDGNEKNPNCICQQDEDNRSIKGDGADEYYELKELREERKRELYKEKKEDDIERAECIAFAQTHEDEVNAAWKVYKKKVKKFKQRGKTISLDPIADHQFKLYSTDYIRFCSYPDPGTQRADFYILSEEDAPGRTEAAVDGGIYLDADNNFTFEFPPSNVARTETVTPHRTDCALEFKFFSNQYLKLSVPRELFDKGWLRDGAPSKLHFFGILRDLEKEKRERLAAAKNE